MSALKWRKGRILYPRYLWKHPTRRRLPKILIFDRASEVGIKVFFEDEYLAFEETSLKPEELLQREDKVPLLPYKKTYLLPETIEGQRLFDYLGQKGASFIIFSQGGEFYYVPEIPS